MSGNTSEKDAKLAQLQPFIAAFPQACMGQLASFGPTEHRSRYSDGRAGIYGRAPPDDRVPGDKGGFRFALTRNARPPARPVLTCVCMLPHLASCRPPLVHCTPPRRHARVLPPLPVPLPAVRSPPTVPRAPWVWGGDPLCRRARSTQPSGRGGPSRRGSSGIPHCVSLLPISSIQKRTDWV